MKRIVILVSLIALVLTFSFSLILSTAVLADDPVNTESTDESGDPVEYSDASWIEIYQDNPSWSNRIESILQGELALVKGTDYGVKPTSALITGIPADTRLIIVPSNAYGTSSSMLNVNNPASQANLTAFVQNGGILVMHQADNLGGRSYIAPGLLEMTTDQYYGNDITLVNTTHPIVKGPDGLQGTADDITNNDLQFQNSSAAHHGILPVLPANATILTRDGIQNPLWAEYPFGNGKIIVTAMTMEFGNWGDPGFPTGYGYNRRVPLNELAYVVGLTAPPPVTTATISPAPNADGWNNTNLTVNLSSVPGRPGTSVASIHYNLDSNPETVVAGNTAAVPVTVEGTHTITYYAIDNAGHQEAAKSLTVNLDKAAPVITLPAGELAPVIEATSPSGTPYTFHATATDNIDPAPSLMVTPSLSVYPLGITLVTFTATDIAGNTGTVIVEIRVIDTTPPVITLPAGELAPVIEATSASGTPYTFHATIADNSDPNPRLTITPNLSKYPLGTTTVVFTGIDATGNQSTVTVNVVVQDTTPPVLNVGPDITREAQAPAGTPVSLSPSAWDICDAQPVITGDAPALFPVGTTIVTFTATDDSGNSVSQSIKVTIIDTTPPTILLPLPPRITVEATSRDGTPVTLPSPMVTDNGDPNPVVTSNAPSVFPLGETIVTWTATDASGNAATAAYTVRIEDTTQPTITAPADITVEQTSRDGTPVDIGTATAADICDANPVISNNAPPVFPLGVTIILWTATDASGNTANTIQTVIVQDTTPPQVIAPADITANTDPGMPYATVNLGTPTVEDNGEIAGTVNDAPLFFPTGTTTVIWTVTDISGNAASAAQTVTVTDIELPTITAPVDVTANTNNNLPYATNVYLGIPTAADNSGNVDVSNNAPTQFPLGETMVTWTATDPAGNTATALQKVTVIDIQPPVITINSPQAINYLSSETLTLSFSASDGGSGLAGISATLDGNAVTDGQVIDLSAMEGSYALTVQANDIAGNSLSRAVAFTVTSARALKSGTVDILDAAKTGNSKIDRVIDQAIRSINRSLDADLWQDGSHLVYNPKAVWLSEIYDRYDKKGKTIEDDDIDDENKANKQMHFGVKHAITVFHQEKIAAILLETQLDYFDKQIPHLEKEIARKQKKGQDVTGELAELNAMQTAQSAFQSVITDLVKADEILAQVAIADAQSATVLNPRMNRAVAHEIQMAQKEFQWAVKEAGKGRSDNAISRFSHAWLHAELALKFANMDVKPPHR